MERTRIVLVVGLVLAAMVNVPERAEACDGRSVSGDETVHVPAEGYRFYATVDESGSGYAGGSSPDGRYIEARIDPDQRDAYVHYSDIAGTSITGSLGGKHGVEDGSPSLTTPPNCPDPNLLTTWGYIPLSDGTHLRYSVVLPAPLRRLPVAINYSPYSAGVDPLSKMPDMGRSLLDAGYAVLGVNVRGTGTCSGGAWDNWLPLSDGYEVVEWAASPDRPWSDGNIGMFGVSAPGVTQLFTAATRPPHLRAIAPSDVATDLYRDNNYPGGINNTFMPTWAALRATDEYGAGANAVVQGDLACVENEASRPQPSRGGDAIDRRSHPFVDDWWAARSPSTMLDRIDVPILTCQAWQDEQLSSRAGSFWLDEVDPSRTWAVFTNGFHGTCGLSPLSPYQDLLVGFFDRFVKGEANGFDATPRVQIWHETRRDGLDGDRIRGWTTTHPSWPVTVDPTMLHLRDDRRLTTDVPTGPETPDRYLYPLPASSTENGGTVVLARQTNAGWKVPNTPGGSVAYTTPPLADDIEVFGPASADLWITSTAPDVDLQVTVTEIRPDGQEVYVQRGWLRASHRKLDPSRSTTLRPYHTHVSSDQQMLELLEPTLVRVEISPFGHVFRAGSAIRLWVEAPTGLTGLWAFDYIKTPAVNAVLHDADHPSRLVLGVVPGGSALASLPACDVMLSQPCRPNAIPVPTSSRR